ncbi:DUF4125 family protein [Demequina sp. SYSU T00192]|uniref:DUF4125 family protein n=1 Tax=Demequina litoralis TaxID=3051660 RepID=A0ABT8G8D2_9MICO|nr:DUF4125 family protein [Demequina sp. SYSU T00192]MDN4475383.1 DUF4125 family protein [Demequina sp. SYSU T00192]
MAEGAVSGDEAGRAAKAEAVVRHEFAQFQHVRGDDGRADCQDDWPTFRAMRLSQFLEWTPRLLDSYAEDLDVADATGRNLLTEKYARMMRSTAPERYAREIAPHLPPLSSTRVALQERIVATQVAWARDFRARYPRLGAGMRVLTTSEDSDEATSLETYLRGELGTYSTRTLRLYAELVDAVAAAGGNLTERAVARTAGYAGFADLDAAEAAQGA